jgi:hypothetical protein
MIGTQGSHKIEFRGAADAGDLCSSFIYGSALQEASLPFESPAEVADVAEPMLAGPHR